MWTGKEHRKHFKNIIFRKRDFEIFTAALKDCCFPNYPLLKTDARQNRRFQRGTKQPILKTGQNRRF